MPTSGGSRAKLFLDVVKANFLVLDLGYDSFIRLEPWWTIIAIQAGTFLSPKKEVETL